MRTIVLSTLITLLGLQSIRVFVTGLLWVVGETSDRVVLGLLALAAFASTILAWPLIRLVGRRPTMLLAASLLAAVRIADQATANPVADVYLGLVGTLAFTWLVVSFLGIRGRESGCGLAAGMALDVAARAGFLTVDVPFASSSAAMAITLISAVGLLVLAYAGSGVDSASVRSSSSWTIVGIPVGLLLFMLVTGNFGQVSATGGIDWSATAALVTAGAVLGLGWAALPDAGRWKAVSTVAAIGLLIAGLALFRLEGYGWAVIALGAALARLLAWMPAVPDADHGSGATSAAAVPAIAGTLGFILFFIFTFVFYSFYAPEWVLIASALVAALAGLLGSIRRAPSPLPNRATTSVVLVLLVLAIVPGAARAALDRPDVEPRTVSDTDTIRIVSYNIRQGFGISSQWDLEAVAAEIERHQPDIVVLQEVGRGWVISGMSDQLLWLSRRLGMSAEFGSNIGDLWGNALLTNFVTQSENHRFDNPGRVPRGVLDAYVLFGGSGVRVLAPHLDHEDDGAPTRLNQIDRVLEVWGGDPSTLIIGDFNAEPDSAEYSRITDAGLRDLLLEAGNAGPTYPSDNLEERIDYAFASSDLEFVRAEAPMSLASDHLPVVVELKVP